MIDLLNHVLDPRLFEKGHGQYQSYLPKKKFAFWHLNVYSTELNRPSQRRYADTDKLRVLCLLTTFFHMPGYWKVVTLYFALKFSLSFIPASSTTTLIKVANTFLRVYTKSLFFNAIFVFFSSWKCQFLSSL